MLAADLSVDTALIQIRSGTQYLSEIVAGNSPTGHNTVVTGVHTVVDADVNGSTPFHKRGITTNYAPTGIAITLGTNGYIVNRPKDDSWHVFHRFYQNAMVFQGTGGSAFSDRGDSGSAVFDDAGNVVGTVFGEGADSTGTKYSHPRDADRADHHKHEHHRGDSHGGEQVQTVTDAEGAPAVVVAGDDALLTQVLTTQAQVTSPQAGKRYAQLITRHAREVQSLINDNRRVTVAWHRNGGPQILRAALRYVERREERLPQEIDELPLTERLSRIGDTLVRHGSAELADDLDRYGGELLDLTRLSYDEALDPMRARERQTPMPAQPGHP